MELSPKLKLLRLYLQLDNPSSLEDLYARSEEIMDFVEARKAVPQSFVNKLERLKNFSDFVAQAGGPNLLFKVWQTVGDEIDRVIDEAVEQALIEQREFEKAHNFRIEADSIAITSEKTKAK